jgi:hypothetical protein
LPKFQVAPETPYLLVLAVGLKLSRVPPVVDLVATPIRGLILPAAGRIAQRLPPFWRLVIHEPRRAALGPIASPIVGSGLYRDTRH